MEFKDTVDYTGAPIEGDETYRMIFTRDELAVAKEALALAVTAGLQNGTYSYTEAGTVYELALSVNFGSGHRTATPETAKIFAGVLESVNGALKDDDRSALALRMATELREEAVIREFTTDIDGFLENL